MFRVAETVDQDEMIKEWTVTRERTAFRGVEGETWSWAPPQRVEEWEMKRVQDLTEGMELDKLPSNRSQGMAIRVSGRVCSCISGAIAATNGG